MTELLRDPDHLYNFFFGGYSLAARRDYEGAFSRVRRGVTESFKEYRPVMRTSSVMGGGSRAGHESYADVGALNDFMRSWIHDFGDQRPGKHRTWLEEHPPPDPPRVLLTSNDVTALLRMVQASVRHHMSKADMNLLTNDEIEALLGLSAAFMSFLSDACSHRSTKRVGEALVCRGCGFTKVEAIA